MATKRTNSPGRKKKKVKEIWQEKKKTKKKRKIGPRKKGPFYVCRKGGGDIGGRIPLSQEKRYFPTEHVRLARKGEVRLALDVENRTIDRDLKKTAKAKDLMQGPTRCLNGQDPRQGEEGQSIRKWGNRSVGPRKKDTSCKLKIRCRQCDPG